MCTAVAILFQENKEHTNSSQQWNGASFLTKKKKTKQKALGSEVLSKCTQKH